MWYVKPEIRAQRGKSCDGREIIKQLSDGKFLTLDRIHYCHYMIYQPQKPFTMESQSKKKVGAAQLKKKMPTLHSNANLFQNQNELDSKRLKFK